MKTLKLSSRVFLAVMTLATALLFAGATQSFADNGYRHDDNGFWDHNNQYHNYDYYHNHRGYWEERNGIRIWINI